MKQYQWLSLWLMVGDLIFHLITDEDGEGSVYGQYDDAGFIVASVDGGNVLNGLYFEAGGYNGNFQLYSIVKLFTLCSELLQTEVILSAEALHLISLATTRLPLLQQHGSAKQRGTRLGGIMVQYMI